METFAKGIYRKIIFRVVKVPLMYFLITLGYIIEFLIHLPFIVITSIDGFAKKRREEDGSS